MSNITVAQNGSTSALTLNTETDLFSGTRVTTVGFYVVTLDLSNLANGDELEWRIYIKLYSGGPEVLFMNETHSYAQAQPAKLSVSVPNPISIRSTVKQTGGTGRVINWALWTY